MVKGLRSLSLAIEKFRGLDDAIPARVIHTFVMIAGWDGDDDPSIGELSTALGMVHGPVSRHVAALSEKHRLGKAGLGVVETYQKRDRRESRVRLTDKGRTLRSQLITIMEK